MVRPPARSDGGLVDDERGLAYHVVIFALAAIMLSLMWVMVDQMVEPVSDLGLIESEQGSRFAGWMDSLWTSLPVIGAVILVMGLIATAAWLSRGRPA